MEMKSTLIIAVLMIVASCQLGGGKRVDSEVKELPIENNTAKAKPVKKHHVDVEKRDSLIIYRPVFKRIDLVTGTMPSKDRGDVILCFEAAFTGQLLDEFKHSNIAGHHVSGGAFYKGYNCRPNNGVFTWDGNYSNTKDGLLSMMADAADLYTPIV